MPLPAMKTAVSAYSPIRRGLVLYKVNRHAPMEQGKYGKADGRGVS